MKPLNDWVPNCYALIRSTKRKTKVRRRQIINSSPKETGQIMNIRHLTNRDECAFGKVNP